MSKRGLHYNYNPGDHVLCFEPDPKKVKVIYPAKVMDHSVRRLGESGQRIPSYRVHFQGWKPSWDREVTEEMLLEDTPFNRELMFRIDEITRRTRRIEEVRDRIERVLNHVGRLRASGKLSSDVEEEAFDWNQVEGILPPPPQPDGRHRARGGARKSSTDVLADSEEEEDEGVHVENLELHKTFTHSLQLSTVLRRVLEIDHQRFLQESNPWALAAGPSEQCVVSFLETYLKSFALRPSRQGGGHGQPASSFWTEEYGRADRSLRLAFEVCSSLRGLFDVFLAEELLYPRERPVHGARRRTGPGTKEGTERPSEEPTDGLPYALLPAEAKRSRALPSCVYPPVYLLRLLVILPELLENMDLSLCRKAIISRHVSRFMRYMEDLVTEWFPQAAEQDDTESEADGVAAGASTSSAGNRKRKRIS